jgi:hypothetical protein
MIHFKKIFMEELMPHNKITVRVEENQYIVEFSNGISREFALPDRHDKKGIKKVADDAVKFVVNQGATIPGQVNAVRKSLTERGYYITHPRGLRF